MKNAHVFFENAQDFSWYLPCLVYRVAFLIPDRKQADCGSGNQHIPQSSSSYFVQFGKTKNIFLFFLA
jgi:hypothetical protein